MAAEALVQISAWFTPVHAERERERQLSNGRRSEACTHAPLTCVFGVQFEFRKEERGELSAAKCARVQQSRERNFGVRLVFFFWWIFLVIHGATVVPGTPRSKRVAAPVFG